MKTVWRLVPALSEDRAGFRLQFLHRYLTLSWCLQAVYAEKWLYVPVPHYALNRTIDEPSKCRWVSADKAVFFDRKDAVKHFRTFIEETDYIQTYLRVAIKGQNALQTRELNELRGLRIYHSYDLP